MKLIITVTTFLLSTACSYAQKNYNDAQRYYDFEAKAAAQIYSAIQSFHWDTLPGKIPVLYSKNYKVRAQTIQKLIEECAAFYQPKFPKIKFDLCVMVLDQKDWYKIHLNILNTYGMPNCIPEISKLFIAADKQAVGKLFGEEDSTSDTHLSRFDVIALHELGHAFLQKFNHLYTGKLWTDEFLASYFATCFLKEHKNYPALPQVGETGYNPPHRTLKDFERMYDKIGTRNYGWYQGQFQNLGYELYPKFKTDLIKKFIADYSVNGKKSEPLVLLKQLSPEITNQWLEEME